MTDNNQQESRLPFDQLANAILQQAHQLIFSQCPEVRSIATSIDYHGGLNDANVLKGVWSSREGPVVAPDAVYGGLFQTLRLVEEQFATAIAVAAHLRDEVQALSAEALRLRREANEETQDKTPADAARSGAAG